MRHQVEAGTTDKQLMGEHSENREGQALWLDANATARTELIGATAMSVFV